MNVRIIGLGNVLMSDDGFGPYAARVLEAFYEFPDNVRIVDAGQPGIDLVPYLANADVVILIDTVRAKGTPGDVHAYPLEEILQSEPHSPSCPHDPRISEALVSVSAAGTMPRHVVLLGVIPEWIATGVWLSDSVRAAIEPAIGLTITELDRLGVRAKRRSTPRQPDTWWERDTTVLRVPH
jgi:hydrogenase maturation protease